MTFVVSNRTNIAKKINGLVYGSEGMRFVLLKTNLAPGKLPVDKKKGLVLEKGRVGKGVDIEPGRTATITLDLKPGKYVALSNVADSYYYGEYLAFKVTG